MLFFVEKCQRKSPCLWRLLTTRWRREGHKDGHFGEFSKTEFLLDKFFEFKKCFCFSNCVSTQPLWVSFAFLASKVTELLWRSLFAFWMAHGTHHFKDGCLFICSKFTLIFFWQKDSIQQNFLLYNKQKKIDNAHFSKNFLDCKKAFIERREVEQLTVYQLLPNLTIWEYFGLLFPDSEPVSMWAPLWDNQTMSRAFFTTAMLLISINLIATLGIVGCYILLLPVYNVEMVAKSKFLDRQVMTLGCRRHPPDAGKLALLIYIQIWSEKLKTNKFSAQTVSN